MTDTTLGTRGRAERERAYTVDLKDAVDKIVCSVRLGIAAVMVTESGAEETTLINLIGS